MAGKASTKRPISHSATISKTKIVVPNRRPELLSRARLLESINTSLDRKLTLLIAPAGFGKTSLLLDLAHSTKLPVCWLSLDPLDRDPQRFIAYLIAALAEKFPGLAAPLQPLLTQIKSIEKDAELLLVTLTNELFEQVEDDFLFILDDFHLLDDVPVISSLLNRFLQLADEKCHVIISSRIPPSLPDLTLMIARQHAEGLNQAELAFQPRELQSYFAQNLHQYVSDEDANDLVKRTGGWITGIILSNQTGTSFIPGADTFTYLSRQVLDQQPPYLREFLLRTSLPDVFNAELCEEILSPFYLEPQRWQYLIDEVLNRNLFVVPLGNKEELSLRYHPLFREFLQQRLMEERPGEMKSILESLTKAYERRGEWEKAYYACQQLGDIEALALVVESCGTMMMRRSFTTLDNWLNSLPSSIIRKSPGLMSLCGATAIIKGNLEEAIELLDTAERIYRNHKKKDIGLPLVLVRRAFGKRNQGNYVNSMKDVEEALKFAEPYADTHFVYAEALRLKGLNYLRLGQPHQAAKHLMQSLEIYTSLKDIDAIPSLMMDAGIAQFSTGEVEAARSLYLGALKYWHAEKNLFSEAALMNNLAVLYQQTGEYNLAAETFERGLFCARATNNKNNEALILLGLGDLFLDVEDFESAARAYQKAEPITQKISGSFVDAYLPLAQAHLAILRKDVFDARRILNTISVRMKTNPSHYERGLFELYDGRIHLLENKYERAIGILEASRTHFIENGLEMEGMWSRIWLASALFKSGNLEGAREEVREALRGKFSLEHSLIIVMRQASPWLQGLQNDSQVGRLLSDAFEKSRRFEAKLPSIRRVMRRSAQSIQRLPPTMVINAFGRAHVQIDGKPITISDWQTQSVRELFFFLFTADRPLTREQIGAVLWRSTEEPAKLKLRFKNDMYRMRQAVRRDIILFKDECYIFNPAVDHEYDVEAFESYLAKSKFSQTTEEKIDNLQKAVDLVHGPYLEDIGATWVWPERERLGQAFLSASLTLAELYQREGQAQQALSNCQRVLNFNPTFEPVYRLMMHIYHGMGDRPSVVRVYRACENTMQEIFELPPSEETQKQFRELIV